MEISKITKGQVFKNYKELCSFINEPVKNGKAKRLQMQELERYISYHKEGNKIVVDEVDKVVEVKVDKRKVSNKLSNNGKYSNDLQTIILDMLANAKGNHVFLSTVDFFHQLNMVNANYKLAKNNVPRLSEITSVPTDTCYNFFNTTTSSLRKKLDIALKALERRKLVKSSKVYCVCIRTTEDVKYSDIGDNIILDKNCTNLKTKIIHRPATNKEIEQILFIEKTVLSDLGCVDVQDCYIKGLWHKYNEEVSKHLLTLNIEYYYKSYKINFSPDIIQDMKEQENIIALAKKDSKKAKELTNAKIQAFIKKNQQSTKTRVSKKDTCKESEMIYLDPNFTEYTSVLVDLTIKDAAEDIKGALKSSEDIKIVEFGFDKEHETNEAEEKIPF